MDLLISLCNRNVNRIGPYPDAIALKVDVEMGTVVPLILPQKLREGKTGMTGLVGYADGFACILAPSCFVLFSHSGDVREAYDLTIARDAHSIAYHDGVFYIVSTGTDSVVAFVPGQIEKTFWAATSSGADTIHLNSAVWHDGSLWVSGFGPKSGTLWRSAENGFVLNTSTGERTFGALYHPHSLRSSDRALWVCESSRGIVHSTAGSMISCPHGYLRGLMMEREHMYVGSTRGRVRSKSTGYLIDSPSDPGSVAGKTGITIFTLSDSRTQVASERFIDLSSYTEEIFDIVPYRPVHEPFNASSCEVDQMSLPV